MESHCDDRHYPRIAAGVCLESKKGQQELPGDFVKVGAV
jgi:hypothetical protein